MSGSRPPHLQRREGTFYLRVRVPSGLWERVGLREVRRSLNVRDFTTARRLAPKYASRVLEAYTMIKHGSFDQAAARTLINNCFADLAQQAQCGFVPRTDEPDFELADQLALRDEVALDLHEQLRLMNFSPRVRSLAVAHLPAAAANWDQLAPDMRAMIQEGVARALLEQDRLYRFRTEDRFADYEPEDPLFRREAAPLSFEVPAPPAQSSLGPPLAEVVERYLKSGKIRWVETTWKVRVVRMGYVLDHLGAATPIASVSAADIRSLADAVCRMRYDRSSKNKSFAARQTDSTAHRISAKTASLIFNDMKGFFRWAATKQGFTEVSPAANVFLDLPAQPKAQLARRPFKASELIQLFTSPLFMGCKSKARRFSPGPHIYKDDRYWLPILGFYTGARLGELVQLHLSDVYEDHENPHISITDAGSCPANAEGAKSVKSKAGVRRVPLHPDLMMLGFADFVRSRRKKPGKAIRLFRDTPFGADKKASTTFSKWFGRLLTAVGLDDPTLVFHSFRHNAEDAFLNALLPQGVIDRIMGHAIDKVSAGYGEGVWLPTAADAVSKMQFLCNLPSLMRPGQTEDDC